jgi:hypothetical protein
MVQMILARRTWGLVGSVDTELASEKEGCPPGGSLAISACLLAFKFLLD